MLNKKTHLLLLLQKYKTQVNSLLNVSTLFFSYLYKCLDRYWANQPEISITTSIKTGIFIAMHLKKHVT